MRALIFLMSGSAYDNDGWQDLFVAKVDQEKFSLYRNLKDETFADVAQPQFIAQAGVFSADGV